MSETATKEKEETKEKGEKKEKAPKEVKKVHVKSVVRLDVNFHSNSFSDVRMIFMWASIVPVRTCMMYFYQVLARWEYSPTLQ